MSEQLARLKAAAFDVEQAIGELLGTAGSNMAAWRTVRRLIDVYVTSEMIWPRNRDGTPNKRRAFQKAAAICGVSVNLIYNQRQAARRYAKTLRVVEGE